MLGAAVWNADPHRPQPCRDRPPGDDPLRIQAPGARRRRLRRGLGAHAAGRVRALRQPGRAFRVVDAGRDAHRQLGSDDVGRAVREPWCSPAISGGTAMRHLPDRRRRRLRRGDRGVPRASRSRARSRPREPTSRRASPKSAWPRRTRSYRCCCASSRRTRPTGCGRSTSTAASARPARASPMPSARDPALIEGTSFIQQIAGKGWDSGQFAASLHDLADRLEAAGELLQPAGAGRSRHRAPLVGAVGHSDARCQGSVRRLPRGRLGRDRAARDPMRRSPISRATTR